MWRVVVYFLVRFIMTKKNTLTLLGITMSSKESEIVQKVAVVATNHRSWTASRTAPDFLWAASTATVPLHHVLCGATSRNVRGTIGRYGRRRNVHTPAAMVTSCATLCAWTKSRATRRTNRIAGSRINRRRKFAVWWRNATSTRIRHVAGLLARARVGKECRWRRFGAPERPTEW